MTDEEFLTWLQSRVQYVFREYFWLQTALITPGYDGIKDGSEEEVKKYEGNRPLAQLGDSLIPLIVRQEVLFVEGGPRRKANEEVLKITGRENQDTRAKLLGIKAHMKLNKRQNGRADPTTLRLALCAIIGAVWLDSEQDFKKTTAVVHHLLIGPPLTPYVNPREISSQEGVESPINFGDWIRTPGTPNDSADPTPGQAAGGNLLDIPNELDRLASGDILTNFPRALSASRTQELNQSLGGDAELNLVHLNLNPAPPLNSASANENTELLGSVKNRLCHPSAVQSSSVRVDPDASSTSTKLLPNYDGNTGVTRPLQAAMVSKRKLSSHKNESPQSLSTHLHDYMSLEKARCETFKIPYSPYEFDLAMSKACPALVGDGGQLAQLKMFYYTIGSPESLVALKEMVKIGRRPVAGNQPTNTTVLSTIERMKVVERLNSKIDYNVFERRYHIYHLVDDNRTANQKTSDGFVNNTVLSISTNNGPRMGNPLNISGSELSRSLLVKLDPTLIPDSPEYKKKLIGVSNVRRLGERYDMLVQKFGYGIIALLPLPGHNLAANPYFNASDNFILSITDGKFKSFVQCIEQLIGKALSDTSDAVRPIVKAIFEKKLSESEVFAIERIQPLQILRYPRGSQELLGQIRPQKTTVTWN